MKKVWPGTMASVLALALAGCAHTPPAAQPNAVETVTGDPLADAAMLLAAAEKAADALERDPLLARLDALGVKVVDGAADDPLAAWRAEAAALETQRPVYRGRALGPAYRRARIVPGETMAIEQIFYAGQRAEIAAQSNGGQPVALAIRNSRTGEVCKTELSPTASCRWLPLFTERFSIELVNRSREDASVYIVFR